MLTSSVGRGNMTYMTWDMYVSITCSLHSYCGNEVQTTFATGHCDFVRHLVWHYIVFTEGLFMGIWCLKRETWLLCNIIFLVLGKSKKYNIRLSDGWPISSGPSVTVEVGDARCPIHSCQQSHWRPFKTIISQSGFFHSFPCQNNCLVVYFLVVGGA